MKKTAEEILISNLKRGIRKSFDEVISRVEKSHDNLVKGTCLENDSDFELRYRKLIFPDFFDALVFNNLETVSKDISLIDIYGSGYDVKLKIGSTTIKIETKSMFDKGISECKSNSFIVNKTKKNSDYYLLIKYNHTRGKFFAVLYPTEKCIISERVNKKNRTTYRRNQNRRTMVICKEDIDNIIVLYGAVKTCKSPNSKYIKLFMK
jgi:hypothetical protein